MTDETLPILYLAFPLEREMHTRLMTALTTRYERSMPDHILKRPDNRHLMIAYLDRVNPTFVEPIADGISHYLQQMPEPRFRFNRFEVLRVAEKKAYLAACATLDDRERWSSFVRRIRGMLRSLRRPKMDEPMAPNVDDRPWSPYVTLGSVADLSLISHRHWIAAIDEIEWRPASLALYVKQTSESEAEVFLTFGEKNKDVAVA